VKVTPILHSRPLSNGLFQIKIRIHKNNKTTFKSTSFSIDKKHWDNNKRRVKELKSIPQHDKINKEIDRLVMAFKNDFNQHAVIKDEGVPFGISEFLNYFALQIEVFKSQNLYNSYKKYEVVKRNLEEFQLKNSSLFVIDLNFLYQFQIFLHKEKGLKKNGVYSYLKVFRTFLKKASNDNKEIFKPESNPFLHFKLSQDKVNRPKLTKNQLEKFKNQAYPEYSHLWKIKNYFMFSFYSGGMRISDLLTLQWRNIDDGYLYYHMRKTNKPIRLKLNENQLRILLYFIPNLKGINNLKSKVSDSKITPINNRFGGVNYSPLPIDTVHTIRDKSEWYLSEEVSQLFTLLKLKKGDEFIFPPLRGVKFKDKVHLLKQISAKTAVINKGLKDISIDSKIGVDISFHIARHTLSDMMRSSRVGLYDISKILGHSDISTTEKYLNSIDQESMDIATSNFYENL
jgi:integrase